MNNHSSSVYKIQEYALRTLLEEINSPVALSAWLRIKYNDGGKLNVSPNDYENAQDYKEDAQCAAFINKNPIIRSYGDPAAVALSSFLDSEAKCAATNAEFPSKIRTNFEFRSVLETARHYCQRILGTFEFSYSQFGPGTSFSLRGQDSNLIRKLEAIPDCTSIAAHYVFQYLKEFHPYLLISTGIFRRERGTVVRTANLMQVIGNRYSSVKKTSDTDRPICIEPLGNMLCQKSIGLTIKRRLKGYGLDIDTRQEFHKSILKGSNRNFATIDLSSASDTISTSLVKFMLPFEWYEPMEKLRCRKTVLPDGDILFNEKFSSMGNGFTFELETLIFYCLLLSVRYHYGRPDNLVSCYGDDMIVPSYLFERTCSLLEDCGFIINQSKSFNTGYFRESCGVDIWYDSYPVNVRPVFLKTEDEGLFGIIATYNTLWKAAHCGGLLDPRYLRSLRFLAKKARRAFPRKLRKAKTCIPIVHPEMGLLDGLYPLPEDSLSRGFYIHRKAAKIRLNRLRGDHVLACAAYGIGSSGVSPRNAKFSIRLQQSKYFRYREYRTYSS